MKLKLIKTKNYSGYLLENIKKVLGNKNFSDFEKWIYGETLGVYRGKPLVYKYQLSLFLSNCPPIAF